MWVSSLLVAFRTREVLRAYFSRINKTRRLSGAGTFFFTIYYLQYKINEVAREFAANVPRKDGIDVSVFD